MEWLLLDPELDAALRALGLRFAQDLIAMGPDPLNASVRAQIELAVPGTSGRFHLKRYVYPSWRTSRHLVGRGSLWGRAPELQEFRALSWLRAHDIPAVRPVAASALRRRGRLCAHALLTEHVERAPDLAAQLRDPTSPLRADAAWRRSVWVALGRSLRAMHLLGFAHRDCHLRNVLARREPAGQVRLWWLDCRRGGVGGLRRGPESDLDALRSELIEQVDAADLAQFEEAYGLAQPDLGPVRPPPRKSRQ